MARYCIIFTLLAGCLSFGGFGTVAGLSEIWTITFMAVERCRAICSIGDTRPTNKQVKYWVVSRAHIPMDILR